MKIGLVFGGGGVVGAAWLGGALEALELQTGWDPRSADRIIGTSAGAVIGALVAGGISSSDLVWSNGSPVEGMADAEKEARSLHDSLGRLDVRVAGLPHAVGSWRLALSTAIRPHRHAAPVVMAGWCPSGFISTAPIKDLVMTFVGRCWPAGGRFHPVAADYHTGRRVAFGRHDAPPAHLPDAVAASCAIPSFYRPVKIDGRRYVDGGICSVSNLDLLCGTDIDLAICLNPLSSLTPRLLGSFSERLDDAMRAQAGRRLGHEARKLRAEGKQVVLLQPGADELAVMGTNLLSGRRRALIAERSRASVAATLQRLANDNVTLPHRRRTSRRLAAWPPA